MGTPQVSSSKMICSRILLVMSSFDLASTTNKGAASITKRFTSDKVTYEEVKVS